MTTVDVDCSGERLRLHPQRALIWPRRKTLLIADTHFGKAATFRRGGINIPAGGSDRDLKRIAALLAECGAERLIVLGDFSHARLRPDEPFTAALQRFLGGHRQLEFIVVRGNHDRHLDPDTLPAALRWRAPGDCDAPFVYQHEPQRDDRGYGLAGHLHPVVALRGPGRDRLRLPVFWFTDDYAVLPSFGGFTGGHPIRPAAADRLYAVTPDGVLAL